MKKIQKNMRLIFIQSLQDFSSTEGIDLGSGYVVPLK